MNYEMQKMKDKIYFKDWHEWRKHAAILGWLHLHNPIIVVDDPETDECVAEWDIGKESGWIVA